MSVTFFCDPGKWSRNQQFLGALVLAVIVLLLAPVGIEGEEPLHLGHDYGYFLHICSMAITGFSLMACRYPGLHRRFARAFRSSLTPSRCTTQCHSC